MRNLDIATLRTFVAIADHESFAAAADYVSRTQSAVSQQMQRLESQLGCSLLEKHGRNKVLTEAGMKLRERARQIVELNDSLLATVQTSTQIKVVKVGVCHDVSEPYFETILYNVRKTHPEIMLEIRSDKSSSLIDGLHRREIDLLMTTSITDGFLKKTLCSSPTEWMCGTEFKFDKSKPLPLILPDEPSLFRSIAVLALDQANIPWYIAYRGQNFGAVRAAVRAGLGLTARSYKLFGEDIIKLGEEHLPILPEVSLNLYMRQADSSTVVNKVFDALRSNL